jgi:type IV pilus assembly protein PilO
MNSAAVIPPPNSSSVLRHVPRLTARARAMLTAMNLHFAGVAALLVLVLYLIIHLVFVAQSLSSHNADAIQTQRNQLKAAEIAARPLRGLDTKLVQSTHDANNFYQTRLPYATSEVAAELGKLSGSNVRLSRAQYSYSGVLSGADALTEMRIDASVSGDYRPVVEFINAIERDKMFFVISSLNLNGQQNGQVNLRIRLTTYLRVPEGTEATIDLPAAATTPDTGGVQ